MAPTPPHNNYLEKCAYPAKCLIPIYQIRTCYLPSEVQGTVWRIKLAYECEEALKTLELYGKPSALIVSRLSNTRRVFPGVKVLTQVAKCEHAMIQNAEH